MMDADAVVDTNILLEACNNARPYHAWALDLLQQRNNLWITAQIAREFLVVATRPTEVNGLGLSTDDALKNIDEFRRFVQMAPEEKPSLQYLIELVRKYKITGKKIHDAAIVATMQATRIGAIITLNPKDFRTFESMITIVTGPVKSSV